jgi:ADP-ribose pyrophosphatase YjhB (NUDIX family)
MQNGGIEVIARGVLIGPHGILLCRAVGKEYTFLPGGHVEYGESAATALTREMQEELQVRIDVDNYLSTVESVFLQDGVTHHEVNIIFEISCPPLVRRTKVTSAEAKLQFQWYPVYALSEARLLPRPLRTMIPQWTLGKHAPWASDVRHEEGPKTRDDGRTLREA